ncbi:hypothetical protein ACHAO4_000990 [Trichoderma viride]
MDEISPTDYALRLMQIKVRSERFYLLSFNERSISRSQAMETLQPMIDKLDQCITAADFVADVETCFTQESIKVLPQHAKRTIRLAAEVVGNKKVFEWIAAAKEDREEYTWMVTIEIPKPPADISRELLEELDILAKAAPSAIQDLLHSRAQVAKMLFESFEQRIREVTSESETHLATNQQLREELSSIRKALEQQPAPKRSRKITAVKKLEEYDSTYKTFKRHLKLVQTQRPYKQLKVKRE